MGLLGVSPSSIHCLWHNYRSLASYRSAIFGLHHLFWLYMEEKVGFLSVGVFLSD